MASAAPSPLSTNPAATSSKRRRWLGARDYWVAQGLFWGAWAALWAFSSIATNLETRTSTDAGYVPRVILRTVGFAVAALFCSHLARVAFHFLREKLQGWRLLLASVVPVMACACALVGIGAVIAALTPPYHAGVYLARWAQAFTSLLHWAGVYWAVSYYRRHQQDTVERLRVEAALQEAQLATLRTQLNPHFLFNALNSVRALIPGELSRPRDAVTRLADLLRATLRSGALPMVPLREELTTVEDYLALEQLRYAARLRVERRVDPLVLDRPVPPFLLQGLVENAIKHGIATQEDEGGVLAISATLDSDALCLRVVNPGALRPAGAHDGVGLRNTRARLELLFGPAARLTLRQSATNEITAEAWLPATQAAPAAWNPPAAARGKAALRTTPAPRP